MRGCGPKSPGAISRSQLPTGMSKTAHQSVGFVFPLRFSQRHLPNPKKKKKKIKKKRKRCVRRGGGGGAGVDEGLFEDNVKVLYGGVSESE